MYPQLQEARRWSEFPTYPCPSSSFIPQSNHYRDVIFHRSLDLCTSYKKARTESFLYHSFKDIYIVNTSEDRDGTKVRQAFCPLWKSGGLLSCKRLYYTSGSITHPPHSLWSSGLGKAARMPALAPAPVMSHQVLCLLLRNPVSSTNIHETMEGANLLNWS